MFTSAGVLEDEGNSEIIDSLSVRLSVGRLSKTNQLLTSSPPFRPDTMSASFTASPAELNLVNQIFSQADKQKLGILSGDVAVRVFSGAKLAGSVLGEIWSIADEENNGWLSKTGTAKALRLIGHAQKGSKVSPALLTKCKFLFPGILCIFIDFWYGQRVHWQSSMTTRQFPSRTPGHPFPIPLLQASLHSLPEIRSSSKIYSIALVPQMVY